MRETAKILNLASALAALVAPAAAPPIADAAGSDGAQISTETEEGSSRRPRLGCRATRSL